MSDIAIRAKHCIVSGGRQPGVEGLSQRCHIGRAHSHGDALRSQHPDTLRDALVARFRRADQVTHSRSTGSRSTRQLLGESYAIAGDVERAAALWRTVDVRWGQLRVADLEMSSLCT